MSMEQDKEHAFDAYCKRLLKNETIDAARERERRRCREIPFSDLSKAETRQLQYMDQYAPERSTFDLFGLEVEVKDGELVRALAAIPDERRAIVLLAYLIGMTDKKIAHLLGLNRSTVQYRRTSTLAQLRKILEEDSDV